MNIFRVSLKLVAICTILIMPFSAYADSQIVIANKSVQSSDLTLNQLRAIFSLRAKEWPDGSKITVVVLEDTNPHHKAFLLNNLKMLPHQLRRQWDRYIYSGIGQGPTVVKSKQDMLDKVNSIPGAVGYVEGGESNEQILTLSIK